MLMWMLNPIAIPRSQNSLQLGVRFNQSAFCRIRRQIRGGASAFFPLRTLYIATQETLLFLFGSRNC